MRLCIFLFFAFFPLSGIHAAIYYSDQSHPPDSEREPPYDITRRHTENEKYYLNIRFPYETERGTVFLISMGNELETLMLYQIKTLELKWKDKPMVLTPSFYNYSTKKEEKGIEALYRYRHPMPPNLHRRVEVICETCQPFMKELVLEIAVSVYYDDEVETLTDNILLYQGKFEK